MSVHAAGLLLQHTIHQASNRDILFAQTELVSFKLGCLQQARTEEIELIRLFFNERGEPGLGVIEAPHFANARACGLDRGQRSFERVSERIEDCGAKPFALMSRFNPAFLLKRNATIESNCGKGRKRINYQGAEIAADGDGAD